MTAKERQQAYGKLMDRLSHCDQLIAELQDTEFATARIVLSRIRSRIKRSLWEVVEMYGEAEDNAQ